MGTLDGKGEPGWGISEDGVSDKVGKGFGQLLGWDNNTLNKLKFQMCESFR